MVVPTEDAVLSPVLEFVEDAYIVPFLLLFGTIRAGAIRSSRAAFVVRVLSAE